MVAPQLLLVGSWHGLLSFCLSAVVSLTPQQMLVNLSQPFVISSGAFLLDCCGKGCPLPALYQWRCFWANGVCGVFIQLWGSGESQLCGVKLWGSWALGHVVLAVVTVHTGMPLCISGGVCSSGQATREEKGEHRAGCWQVPP